METGEIRADDHQSTVLLGWAVDKKPTARKHDLSTGRLSRQHANLPGLGARKLTCMREANTADGKAFGIAVVGMACRFPGAANADQFWSLLKGGIDSVGEIPAERWDVDAHFHPDPARPGKMYTRAGGFIPAIDQFDAAFFGISPREARRIDPQQRMLLELTWEALEDAGIVPARLAGSETGVFVGISTSDYAALQREEPDSVDAYVMSGSAISNAANRISYVFDLHGPSFAVDTACSSSLVAVHEACVSLWRGETSEAIVAGVNALLSPSGFVGFSKAHMLSPAGHCRPFDAAADGYARSEGGAVLILKPLAQAISDGNPIHAVIVGSGVNSDGRTAGLAMPNQMAQEALLRGVYRNFGIASNRVDYVEAHGTGTSVGDPAECNALGAVFGASRPSGDCCRIGSVKGNIGHLEPASGMAGLLKVILALRHRALPPTLHFATPNPRIPFETLNLSVVSQYLELGAGRLTMGVNSFGFGGTNAHVVLRTPELTNQLDERSANAPGDQVWPLLISARSANALTELAARYRDSLSADNAPLLANFCRAAATRRAHHEFRSAVFGRSCTEIADRLDAFVKGGEPSLLVEGRAPSAPARLAFVFSGNGSQWFGMGRDLLADPLAAHWISRVDDCLGPYSGLSVTQLLTSDKPTDLYARTEFAQPALFAIQVAVTEWLRAHGVEAEAVLGHSVGEVAAAYAAGALSLADACRVIAERSRAQAPTAGAGRMAAVGLSAEEAAAAIAPYGEGLTVAAINAPRSVTVAGDAIAIESLGRELEANRTFFRALELDYAFHSRAMDAIRGGLVEGLQSLAPQTGDLRFVSTVTGGVIEGQRLDAEYWWENVRKPVLFAAAIKTLLGDGYNTFIEIGPHVVLDAYVREGLKASGGEGVTVATLRRNEPERDALWLALGRCYAAGVAIDYDRLCPGPDLHVPLPSYPWQRERYWFRDTEQPAARKHPLLGKRLPTVDGIWQNQVDPVVSSWLADHVIRGSTVLPGAAYIEMAIAAACALAHCEAVEIEGLEIRRPMLIAAGSEPSIEVGLVAEDGSFRVGTRQAGPAAQIVFATGRAIPLTGGARRDAVCLDALRSRLRRRLDGSALYRRFAAHGLDYGRSFQGVVEAWTDGTEALGRIVAPASVEAELPDYRIHPALLDACLQVTLAALPDDIEAQGQAIFVPTKVDRARFYGDGAGVAWCHVTVTGRGDRSIYGKYVIAAAHGQIIAEIDGVCLRRLDLGGARTIPAFHWEYEQRPLPTAMSSSADLPTPLSLLTLPAGPQGERWHDGPDETHGVIEQVAAAYASQALLQLADASQRLASSELIEAGKLAPERRAYFVALLKHAEQAGIVACTEDGWKLADPGPTASPARLWKEALARHPAQFASLNAVARWGEALQTILSDASDHDPSAARQGVDDVEQLYDSNPAFRRVKDATERVLANLFELTASGRRLRILEIGGRGGGLASAALRAAPRHRVEYVLTDPDEAAVSRLEDQFAGQSWARCMTLDLAKETAEQGFCNDDYDVVIAGAGADRAPPTDAELGTMRELLRPGGILLVAIASPSGLSGLAGYGQFDRPVLDEADWDERLRRVGFEDVVGDATGGSPAGEVVRVSRKPPGAGVVAPASGIAPATYLILADDPRADFIAATTDQLKRHGHRIIVAGRGEGCKRLGLDRFVAQPGDRDSYDRLFAMLAAEGIGPVLDLLHLRAVDEIDPPDPLSAQSNGSFDLLAIIQAIVAAGLASSTRITVVTRGAMPLQRQAGGCDRPWQAPLWGVLRTARTERPDLFGRLIDIDPEKPLAEASAALVEEILHPDGEDEVLLHDARFGLRLVPGLTPRAPRRVAEGAGFTLSHGAEGPRDEAIFRAIEIPRPASGEVAVRVCAAGVNFRDVLQRIGLLPAEAFEGGFAGATLGLEFAGEVIAVGNEVETLAPGDAVFGFGRRAFSSHLVAPAFGVLKKPPFMNFAEAATLPVAAATVYYSLHHLARLQPGERVLIHGAAGGVGLAAIQYAQAVGAEIFASAGSPEKRAFLRRLGVPHVVDSRSLTFADEIREITRGEGIDVVLNSIAGEAVHKGLSILRAYGRFIELGKRDFYANSKLGLQHFANNIQFSGVDLDRLLVDRPLLVRQIFAELAPLIERRVFTPLPHRVFPVTRAVDAFRFMQHSRHIGKIVLSMDRADWPTDVRSQPESPRLLSPNATYLISGGRGGFGLATAEWLAGRGARHLALIGRSAATADDAAAALRQLRSDGVTVQEFAIDVADYSAMASLINRIEREMPPLKGVIHCAGVIKDAALINLGEDEFFDVLRPKIAGAWNLHLLTRTRDLDFFVMYSSATTLFGNAGQANYVAANLYLEALAAHRRGLGLPGLAVCWGAIGDVGHLARSPAVARLLKERLGVQTLSPSQALDRLIGVMSSDMSQVAVADMDWSRLGSLPSVAKSPKFGPVRSLSSDTADDASPGNLEEFRARLSAMPPDQAVALIEHRLIDHIADVLGVATSKLRVERSLLDLGMDSLMLVETQLKLEKEFGLVIPIMELMDMTTVAKLSRRVVDQLVGISASDLVPLQTSTSEATAELALEEALERTLENRLDQAKTMAH